jgi:hypothetical protein
VAAGAIAAVAVGAAAGEKVIPTTRNEEETIAMQNHLEVRGKARSALSAVVPARTAPPARRVV